MNIDFKLFSVVQFIAKERDRSVQRFVNSNYAQFISLFLLLNCKLLWQQTHFTVCVRAHLSGTPPMQKGLLSQVERKCSIQALQLGQIWWMQWAAQPHPRVQGGRRVSSASPYLKLGFGLWWRTRRARRGEEHSERGNSKA